jgi:O-antigen/teichoic acid export membrane protein
MKSDHGRRLARGAVIVLSADGAAIGFGVLLVVYLARALGAGHFGLWTLASSVIL